MRKILLAVLALAFIGCGSDESEPGIESHSTLTALAVEYGIDYKKIEIDGYTDRADTALIFFHGRNESKLWIWGYEKSTKSRIYEYLSDFSLPTEITIDLGYGETATYNITNYGVNQVCPYKGKSVFLMTYVADGGNYGSNQLFFVNGSVTVKNLQIPRRYVHEIHNWYEGNVLLWSGEYEKDVICYSIDGEDLYSFKRDLYYNIQNALILDILSVNEYISAAKDGDDIMIQRRDLKSEILKWGIRTNHFSNLSESYRIDNCSISKAGNIWNYTFSYTLYSGKKGTYNIKINIEAGEAM